MPPKRDPVPRARAAGHWLAGILVLGILAGGVVAAAVLLWENLDVRQLAPGLAEEPGPLPDPEPPPPPGVERVSFRAVLFRSARNAHFFPDTTYYSRSLERWRNLVGGVGGTVRETRSPEELRGVGPEELLVVPAAPCLSSEEVGAIQAHLQAGGNLVANWAVGARDERCAWRGWQTVASLTGAGDVRELGTREALYLTVPAGTPLSPGLDPGTRIELVPEASLALHLPGPRVYWSDWALNPAPDESGGAADVAVATANSDGGGRVAWFGFRLSQAATPLDSLRTQRLLENGIRWAAGSIVTGVSPWPDGKRAALVLAEDVEAEFLNSLAMARLLRQREVPGSFYAVSQLVMDHADLADSLSSAGEVGSQTSDHTPVAGLPYDDQAVRLRRAWLEIRGWTGIPPQGLRPPEEAFDGHTLRAWHDAGGRYVLAVNQARSGSPEVHRAGEGRIILLPRLIKDDYNVFVQEGAMRGDRLSAAFQEGIGKVRAMGGLAVVAVHTQIVGTDRRLDAVAAVIDTATAQGDWWIARAADVAEWWGTRAGVRVTIDVPSGTASTPDTSAGPGASTVGEHAPVVVVQGPADASVSGVWIDVILPFGPDSAAPYIGGVPIPYSTTGWGLRIPVADLQAGERRLITLRAPPA